MNRSRRILPLCLLFLLVMTACSLPTQPVQPTPEVPPTSPPVLPTDTLLPSPLPSDTPTSTATFTPEPSPTPTETLTPSLTPTVTLVPSPTPVPVTPRVEVLMRSQCRYGPGAAYLFKYGLLAETTMDVIGRREILSQTDSGAWEPATWLYIIAHGGDNPCWINSKLTQTLKGDIMTVPEMFSVLPASDLYLPPTTVSAARNGNEVSVFWSYVWMTEDDYRGYLVEAWVCKDGKLWFAPVRSDALAILLPDEPGCSEPSSARVYTAEKHGYTQWRQVIWPGFDGITPSP